MEINRIEKTRLELLNEGKKIINLSSGLIEGRNIYFPPQILKKGLSRFLKNAHYHPESKGSFVARKVISKYYQKRKVEIDPNHIILTSGTSESYFELFKLLAKPGEEILFPNPAYPLFEHIAGLAEIKISFYKLDPEQAWQIDIPSLESKITANTKAIVLISPNNPTGSILSTATLQKIIEIAHKHQLPLISDEVFAELIFDGKNFPRIANLTKDLTVFTLNGVSKTYALPGLKISWIAATGLKSPELVEKLEYITDTFLTCNQISQNLLPDILVSGESFCNQYVQYLQHNRDLAVEILSQNKNIAFQIPAAGPYLFAKIKGLNCSDETFVIKLMKTTGIFIHPGYFYDYENGVNILISFAMAPRKLRACLTKVLHFIEKF